MPQAGLHVIWRGAYHPNELACWFVRKVIYPSLYALQLLVLFADALCRHSQAIQAIGNIVPGVSNGHSSCGVAFALRVQIRASRRSCRRHPARRSRVIIGSLRMSRHLSALLRWMEQEFLPFVFSSVQSCTVCKRYQGS